MGLCDYRMMIYFLNNYSKSYPINHKRHSNNFSIQFELHSMIINHETILTR